MSEISDQAPSNEISDQVDDKETVEDSKDSVKYDTFQRLLRQTKAKDEKIAEMAKQLEEIRMKEEVEKQESLKKQQKFEEYSKELEKKLENEAKEKAEYKKTLFDQYKLNAVLEKIGRKPKKSEYLKFIDVESVQFDETTGELDPSSLEEVANSVIQRYGSDLFVPVSNAQLPNDAASGSEKITFEQWEKMSAKEKRANLHKVVQNDN